MYNWHDDKERKDKQCSNLQIRDLVQHGTWQQEAGCCLEGKGRKGKSPFFPLVSFEKVPQTFFWESRPIPCLR